MFESAVRPAGDFAGVFEFDGDTGYFYLYQMDGDNGEKLVGSVRVFVGKPDFMSRDVLVRWSKDETKVGLFIRNQLWAAFDAETRTKFGGDYRPGNCPTIPANVTESF